jgi:hypothetical protein
MTCGRNFDLEAVTIFRDSSTSRKKEGASLF